MIFRNIFLDNRLATLNDKNIYNSLFDTDHTC